MALRIGGRRKGSRSVTTRLLETLPPIFHFFLLSFLTFFTFYFHPNSPGWHMATVFIVAQIVSNWVMFLMHKSVVLASKKNFPGYVHRFPALTSSKDKRTETNEYATKHGQRGNWRECETCDMHVPLRTHHCGHCGRCIYALDHHCYFLGHCVGRTNMRFFIVFCMYACIGCAMGVYTMIEVMRFYRDLWASNEVGYYVLPVTAFMYMMGLAEAFEVLYVGLINFGMGACGATAFLFVMGVMSAMSGRSPYEEKRKVKTVVRMEGEPKDEMEMTPFENFKKVFGEWGIMHFLVPYVPFDGPKKEEGFRRIITYNNDYILNGTVQTSDGNLDFSA